MKQEFTTKDIIERIDDRTQRIEDMFATFHKDEFIPLKDEVGSIKQKVLLIGGGVVLGIQLAIEWIKAVFFKQT